MKNASELKKMKNFKKFLKKESHLPIGNLLFIAIEKKSNRISYWTFSQQENRERSN